MAILEAWRYGVRAIYFLPPWSWTRGWKVPHTKEHKEDVFKEILRSMIC
jgi:hypothetical protein